MTSVAAEAFELPDTDITIPEDVAPLRCQHDGCTNGVTKPARGRVPKYCDVHKASNSRNTGSRSNASGKSWPRAKEIETHLTDSLILMGKGVGLLNEFDGAVIQAQGPAVVTALVELAKDDKTLQRYLVWMASPGKYGPLLMACGSVVFPILMNHNMLPGMGRDVDGGE